MSIIKKLLGKKGNESMFQKQRPQYLNTRQTPSGIYEDYSASDAESAKEFLLTKTVDKPKYYIKVETPEGNWGMDKEGLYLERLLPFQLEIDAAQCEGAICEMPNLFSLQTAINGISDNFVVKLQCGQCRNQWMDGIRYQNITIVRCPHCRSLNRIDSRCEGAISWFWDR